MRQTLSTTKANLLRQQAHSFHLFLSYYIFIHLVSTCHHVMERPSHPILMLTRFCIIPSKVEFFILGKFTVGVSLRKLMQLYGLGKTLKVTIVILETVLLAMQHAQYVLYTIFSTGGEILTDFKLYGVARSYSSHLASLPGSSHWGESLGMRLQAAHSYALLIMC